ncbi:MAG TPA: hypothetical protein ENN41_09455 [Sediminispirochaeta sp.]|nr:hypothetical protein [Sediminispirochaeta sp.]
MKRGFLILGALILGAASLWAQEELNELFAEIDEQYQQEDYRREARLLEEVEALVSTDRQRAELLWRRSRSVLNLADEAEKAGAEEQQLLSSYEKGKELASQTLQLDPNSHHAYYWRAANVGRWGQTKGILNSLMKAGPMRDDLERAVRKEPEHADSYYVLGMLYASVPKLISFGNVDYAVSYSRRAIDLYRGKKTKYSYYLKLGEHLQQRDWSRRKRLNEAEEMRSDYFAASDPVEKNKFFEGTFDFSAPQVYSPRGVEGLSDEEEAIRIMEWIRGELEGRSGLLPSEEENLDNARSHLADW